MKKSLLLLVVFIFISLQVHSQKGSIVSMGLSTLHYSSEAVPLNTENTAGMYLTYEYIPSSSMTSGFRYNRSVGSKDLKYWDLRLFMGVLIQPGATEKNPNRKSRFQFPVVFNVSYFGLDDKESARYGYIGIGLQAGARMYATNKIAIEGFINLNRNFINQIDETRLTESIGHIATRHISIGVSYFIDK